MNSEIRFYGRLLVRRAPVMLLIILVCSAIGIAAAMRLPTVYRSTARLLVEPPQIQDGITVDIAPLEEIELRRTELMTRANLIEIAHDHDVFENMSSMSPDEVHGGMWSATSIWGEGGDSRRTGPMPAIMTVDFTARSGQIAADVVNDYVTRITAASSNERGNIARSRLNFYEQQVARLSRELDNRSAAISEFQRDNADALPADQTFRLQRQSLLQTQLATAERDLAALRDTRARTIEVWQETNGRVATGTTLTPDQQALAAAEDQLDQTLLTFSENSPQVQQLRRRIEQLEDRIASQAPPVPEVEEGADEDVITDPQLAVLVADFDSRISALEVVIADSRAELERLDDAISRTPQNGIRLAELQRNLDNIRVQYDQAQARLADAAAGEVIETGGRGQRLTLIEPPVVPSRPAAPNRTVIAGAGVAAGLGLAALLFIALEILNRSVRRPVEMTRSLGISPLATVPYIESAGRRLWRRSLRVAAVLAVLIGVPAVLWAIDQYYLPLDLLTERLLGRLGLA
ncbi:lipopolysaccharide biosynthesis [Rhodobacterales bacterium HKCCE2091]|nr:lipopolysaccharide biosynthesis [Rhodobacterales bacterium HKCCE2091]